MAKKLSKKEADEAVRKVLASVHGGTPKTCSKSGSKLAADKSSTKAKSTAGKKLGSMACKAPARRTKVGKR